MRASAAQQNGLEKPIFRSTHSQYLPTQLVWCAKHFYSWRSLSWKSRESLQNHSASCSVAKQRFRLCESLCSTAKWPWKAHFSLKTLSILANTTSLVCKTHFTLDGHRAGSHRKASKITQPAVHVAKQRFCLCESIVRSRVCAAKWPWKAHFSLKTLSILANTIV